MGKGDNESALLYLHDALRIKESLQDDEKSNDVSDILCDIASIEKDEGQYTLALSRFEKALSSLQEKITLDKYKIKAAKILHNIGALYVKMERFSEAIQYFDDALVTYQKCGLDEDNAIVQDVLLWISYLENKKNIERPTKQVVSSDCSFRRYPNAPIHKPILKNESKIFKSAIAA